MASDVEIVVGAKDQASKILQQIAGETRQMTRSVQTMAAKSVQSTKRMEVGFQSLKAAAGPLLAVFAAVKGATAAFSFGSDSIEAFNVQEEAVRRLTKAIELNGESVANVASHQAYASSLQALTNVGDEVTLGLMAQASALGVADDQLQNTSKAAIGLSEATGLSLDAALQQVQRAMAGDTSGLTRYIPALKAAETASEKLAIVQDLAAKGLLQKQDATNTAAGAAQRAANAWGDFKETVGAILAPIQQLVGTGLAVAAEVLQDALAPALVAAGAASSVFETVVKKMTKGIVASITAVEVVVTNIPVIWEMAVASAELQIVRLVEIVKHAFTVAIPTYARWFSDNLLNLGRDAFVGYITIVQNMAKKVGNILVTLWDFVASGGSGGFEKLFADIAEDAAGSLLEGFEAKTEPLPDVVARQITAREQELTSKIGKLGGDLSDQFQTKFSDRMKKFEPGKQAEDALKVAALNFTSQEEDKKLAEAAKAKSSSATGASFTATVSRLGTRGGPEQGLSKVQKAAEETRDQVKDAVAALNKLYNVAIRPKSTTTIEKVG